MVCVPHRARTAAKVRGSRRRQRAGVPGSSPRTHRRRVFSCRVGVKHSRVTPRLFLIPYGVARNTRHGGERMNLPIAQCPKCGYAEPDYDGFGMLACDDCGWCSHPDSYGGVCNICGEVG